MNGLLVRKKAFQGNTFSTSFLFLQIFTFVAAATASPQLMLNNWAWSGMPAATTYSTWGMPAVSPYSYPAWGMPQTYTAILPKTAEIMKKTIIADDTLKMDTPDYANKGEYIAESAGVIHKAKRSADPILSLAYSALPWAYNRMPLATMPLAYKTAGMPITYNAMPYAYSSILPVMPKMIADDTLKAGTPEYAMKGRYIAESAGIVHKAKRSAEEKEEKDKIIMSSPMPLMFNNFGVPSFYNRLPITGYSSIPTVSTIPDVRSWPMAATTLNTMVPMVAQRPLFF